MHRRLFDAAARPSLRGARPRARRRIWPNKPIFAGADVPGNLALALSVEYPTAISIANLGNYSDTTQYLGYFDPAKCYYLSFQLRQPIEQLLLANSINTAEPARLLRNALAVERQFHELGCDADHRPLSLGIDRRLSQR